MSIIVSNIRKALKKLADEKTRLSTLRFFKEKVTHHGVKSAVVGRISAEFFKAVRHKSKAEIFALCEELWKSGYMEESFIACDWSYRLSAGFEPEDFKIFDRWVHKYVGNWASCDTLSNHTVGAFIEKYPDFVAELKAWARSKNRWVKRAAAVSLIIPARRGKFLVDIFEIAGLLLTDPDDMVQKGYGWMLKAASQAHEKQVFAFVMKHKALMPRTALRYAIEKMHKNLKKQAMQK